MDEPAVQAVQYCDKLFLVITVGSYSEKMDYFFVSTGMIDKDELVTFKTNDGNAENRVLQHLEDREVLEKKGDDNYKIQVKLFQEWLLNH